MNLSGSEVVWLAVLGLASVAAVLWGASAYLGRWGFLRQRMLADPQGQVHAAGLWLGLAFLVGLSLPVLPKAETEGGFGPLHAVVLALVGLLMVPGVLIALGRPTWPVVRPLLPAWWRRERL